jgi:hypothetical protein
VLDIEIESALSTIEDCYNPEIHHYQHGTHPGIKWYIKTVLPGPLILNSETIPLFDFWKSIERRHKGRVLLTDVAYNWSGIAVTNWWTIWLHEKIDISWSWSADSGFGYQVIDHDIGLKNSGSLIEALLSTTDDRLPIRSRISYAKLLNIASFLKTYTSDQRSKQNRSKMRVIHHDEIFPEAPN